jgi:hypothetical protein
MTPVSPPGEAVVCTYQFAPVRLHPRHHTRQRKRAAITHDTPELLDYLHGVRSCAAAAVTIQQGTARLPVHHELVRAMIGTSANKPAQAKSDTNKTKEGRYLHHRGTTLMRRPWSRWSMMAKSAARDVVISAFRDYVTMIKSIRADLPA